MTRNSTCHSLVVPDPCKCLTGACKTNGKWAGSWLPVIYRTIYGYFFAVYAVCKYKYRFFHLLYVRGEGGGGQLLLRVRTGKI